MYLCQFVLNGCVFINTSILTDKNTSTYYALIKEHPYSDIFTPTILYVHWQFYTLNVYIVELSQGAIGHIINTPKLPSPRFQQSAPIFQRMTCQALYWGPLPQAAQYWCQIQQGQVSLPICGDPPAWWCPSSLMKFMFKQLIFLSYLICTNC